ncbi:hypothetical protein A2U01_0022417, partial [Trifolium medium]|nr:hypothetical protein [Trifolium medium]
MGSNAKEVEEVCGGGHVGNDKSHFRRGGEHVEGIGVV